MKYIYKIYDATTCYYVGQTKDMEDRLDQHKKRKGYGAGLIPEGIEWKMDIIEEVEDNLAFERENYWFDKLKPKYNKCRPRQSAKEYRNNNKEKIKEKLNKWLEKNPHYKETYNGLYFETHKEELIQKARQYREANRDKINERRRELYKIKNANN